MGVMQDQDDEDDGDDDDDDDAPSHEPEDEDGDPDSAGPADEGHPHRQGHPGSFPADGSELEAAEAPEEEADAVAMAVAQAVYTQHEPEPATETERVKKVLLSALDSVRANEVPEFSGLDKSVREQLEDVEFAVERFGVNLRVADDFGHRYPCLRLRDGDPVPIDVLGCMGYGKSPHRYYPDYYFEPFLYGHPYSPMGSAKARLEPFALDEVVGFFKGLLGSFLTQRLDVTPTTSESPFTVHTKSPGLRVHYAGRYFIRPDEVFGSPTSPVKRALRPGIYVFGVYDGATNSLRYSDAAYTVPDHEHAHLVEF